LRFYMDLCGLRRSWRILADSTRTDATMTEKNGGYHCHRAPTVSPRPVSPTPTPSSITSPPARAIGPSSSGRVFGAEYLPDADVAFYHWLDGSYETITRERISKENLRFVIQGTNESTGTRYLKVSFVEPNGRQRIGWVPAPGDSTPLSTVAAPIAANSASATTSTIQSEIIGTFERFDRATRTLIVKDAIGAPLEITLRDDTAFVGVGGQRADDYLELHPSEQLWTAGQQIAVVWRASADRQKRVAISIR